jgi:hypothetical protein
VQPSQKRLERLFDLVKLEQKLNKLIKEMRYIDKPKIKTLNLQGCLSYLYVPYSLIQLLLEFHQTCPALIGREVVRIIDKLMRKWLEVPPSFLQ